MAKAYTAIACQDINLQRGKGNSQKGGGIGGYYWHIFVGVTRVGKVFINLYTDRILGQHAAIQLFINKSMRGRHIGQCVYRIACEQSNYDVVYAHMRKSNVASKKAALKAGFEYYLEEGTKQLTLIWNRTRE